MTSADTSSLTSSAPPYTGTKSPHPRCLCQGMSQFNYAQKKTSFCLFCTCTLLISLTHPCRTEIWLCLPPHLPSVAPLVAPRLSCFLPLLSALWDVGPVHTVQVTHGFFRWNNIILHSAPFSSPLPFSPGLGGAGCTHQPSFPLSPVLPARGWDTLGLGRQKQ